LSYILNLHYSGCGCD